MKNKFLRFSIACFALFLTEINFSVAQSPVFFSSANYANPNSWTQASAAAMGTLVGTNIHTTTPNGTGNQYFRFYSATVGGTTYEPNGASDILITANTSTALQISGVGMAYYLNIANAASNVVFKTNGSGTPGTSRVVAFEVQGTVRTVSTVTQSPVAASVFPGQTVTVTANLSGAFATGQGAYLRYSNDGFATSTVVQMTGGGTVYTANIPASLNIPGAGLSYYVFTSGNSGPAANGSDADLFTINLNNNGGSNYSYTVASGWVTAANGNWGTAGTWTANAVPPVATDMGSVVVGHNVTLNQDALMSALTINGGATFTASDASPRTLTISNNVSGTNLSNSGTWANGAGGSTLVFAGTATHTIAGTSAFNNVNTTTGINFGAGSTINNNFQINAGGFVSTNGPTYANTSTLIYNSGGTFVAGTEWYANVTSGQGVPNHVLLGNGVNTTVTFGTAALFRHAKGNVSISASSALTLSTVAGGDLQMEGDFAQNGTLTHNGRSVGFVGSNAQSISGTGLNTAGASNNIPYLVINNSSVAGVTINSALLNSFTSGNGLQLLNSGPLNIAAGITYTVAGANGNLLASGGNRVINFNAATSVMAITAAKTVTSAAGGLLDFTSSVSFGTLRLTAAVNFGANLTSIGNNTYLQINTGGSVLTNPPAYLSGSTLNYNSGAVYGRGPEWSAVSGSGYPYHVLISTGGTTLNLGNGATGVAKAMAGNLTINDGCTLTMNVPVMTASLTVAGDVNIGNGVSGTLALSTGAGGSLSVGGNFTKTSGTFACNGRSVTFNGTANQTFLSNTAESINFLIVSNIAGTVNINSDINIPAAGNSATFNANTTTVIDAAATLTMNEGTTFTGNNAGSLITVNGILRNTGTTNGATFATLAANLLISSTGTYNHNLTKSGQANLGAIPVATWSVGSTCLISGLTNPTTNSWFTSGATQSFSHFTWNTTALTTNPNMLGATLSVGGTFTMLSTNTGALRMGNATGGIINCNHFTQSGGTIDMGNTSGSGTINCTGTFNFTGGTITELGSGTAHLIHFNGTLNQTITFSGTLSNLINFKFNNAAGYTFTGNIPVNTNASVNMTQGAFSGAGTITYNASGTTLVYDGTGSITTTSYEFPATNGPVNVTINNAGGVTLHASRTLPASGVFTELAGVFRLGNFDLTLDNIAAAALVNATPGAGNMIATDGTGQLKRTLPAAARNLFFYIGDETGTAEYSGIQLNFTANNTVRVIGIRCVDATSGNMNTPTTPFDYLSRSWLVTLSTNAGTYTYTPTLTYTVAGDVNGTESQLQVSAFNGGSWTAYPTTVSSPTISTTAAVTQATCSLNGTEFSGRTPMKYWVGGTVGFTTDWNTAANWNPVGVPVAADNIVINSGAFACIVPTGGSFTVNHVYLNGTGNLQLAGTASLTVAGNFNYVNTASATFACGSTFTLSNATNNQTIPAFNYGNLNVAGGPRTLANAGTIGICGNYTPTAGALTTTGSTVNFNGTAAQNILVNATTFNNLTISNTAADVNAAFSVNVNGNLQVNTNARFEQTAGTLTIAGTGAVDGFIRNSGATVNATGALTFNSGGTYELNHTNTAGGIPTATWHVNSTCSIMGYTTGGGGNFSPGGLTQSFGNFIWNCPAQSSNARLDGNLSTINGDFSVISTGGSKLRLVNNTTEVINVGGDLVISGGYTSLSSGNNANVTMNVAGNFSQTAGTLDLADGNNTPIGYLAVAGTFNLAGGTLGQTSTTPNNGTVAFVEWNGTVAQNVTIAGTIQNTTNFRTNNNAGVTLTGTLPINQNGFFYRKAGTITGGTISYSATGTTLVYEGTNAMTTSSNEWPTVNPPINLELNTTNVISLHASRSLGTTGVFTETSGVLSLGAFDLNLTNNNAGALVNAAPGAGNMIAANGSGQLLRAIGTGATNLFFYIGDLTGTAEYSGIRLQFTANNTARVVGLRCVDATSPNMNTPYAPIDYLSRSWHVTLSTTAGTYTYRPYLTYDVAGDVNGTENNLQVAAFFGGAWTHYATTVASPTINNTGTVNQGTCPLDGVEFSGRTPVKYWVGGVLGLENDWNTANNWLPSGVPVASDNIDINDGTYACNISTALTPTVNHLTLNGTGVLNLLGNAFLTIAGNFTYNPTATATFSCTSTFRLSNAVFNQTVPALNFGNLNIAGGARTLINGGTIGICGNYTPTTGALTTTGSHVDFNGTVAQSILTNNTSFNNLTISNTSANVSTARSVTINGIMQVNASARYEQTGLTLSIAAAGSANVDGFLRNSAAAVTATGTMVYSATGVYEHNFTNTAGTIPTSTWNAGSTCLIMGYTTGGPPLGLGQAFSNFTWNCPAQNGNINLAGNLTTVNGNLTITSTNASQLILTGVNAGYTINVGGNFLLSSGTFNLRSNNNNVATTFNLGGNFTQNGGTFTRSGTGATLPVVNLNHASNTQILTQTAGAISTNINWNVNGAANTAELASNFNLGAGTGTFTVAGGASMDFKTFVLSGGAAFTAATSSTLITANTNATGALMTAGANGSVQTTGARTFTNTGVNYTFNGTAAQFTGNAIAAAANIGTLNLSNTSGANPALTFNASTTVATAVNVNSGINQLGVNNITVTATNAAAVSGGSATAFIQTNSTGELRRAIANIGLPITYDFPVGTSSNYTPASYNFTTNTIARDLRVRAVAGTHPQMNVPNPQVDFIGNRYWKTDLSNNTGIYTYTATYTYLPGDINGTLANIALNRYDNGSLSWSEDAGSSAAGNVLSSGVLTNVTGALTVTPTSVQADWVGRIINGTYIWNGSVSSAYTTAGNWTPPIVGGPSAIDNIVINVPGTNQLNVTGAVTVYHLTLNGTGVLNMAAGSSFTVNGNLTTGGTPTANFDCASTFNIARSNTQTIPAFTYGNLNISGGNRILANAGTIGICGVYTPTAGITTSTGSTVNFMGAAQNVPASNYNNIIISGSGTKTVTGNLTIDGNLNISAGTLDVGGFVADRTSPGGVLTLSAGTTILIGGTSTLPANYNTHTIDCNSTVDYYGTAQTIADLNGGANYGNLTLSGSGVKTLQAGTNDICGDFSINGTAVSTGVVNMTVHGDFNIAAGASFTTGAFTYNLKSDFSNAGTFTAGGSTFDFNGIAAQQITGNNTFENLTLDNGSTLTINNDEVVLSALVLTSGVLDLNNNDLTLGSTGNNGSLTGGGFTNYIMSVGPASRFIRFTTTASPSTYLFPLGDATGYTPISIELYSGSMVNANSTLTAYMVLAAHPNLGTSPNFISRYWSVEPANYGSNVAYTATYVYKNTDITGVEANLKPFKYNSDGWIAATGSGAVFEMGAGSVNPGTNTVSWSGIYTFSDFTASGGGSPLPISLVEFNASQLMDAVQLTWVTASELNNDFFTLERSEDGLNFEPIHIEDGAGNSNTWLNYAWVDHSPLKGLNYYRLKQTDFDGTSTYSTIRTVDFNMAGSVNNAWVNIYPNPSLNGRIYLTFGSLQDNQVNVSIHNLMGQLLQYENFSDLGNRTTALDIQNLPVGVYTIFVQNGDQVLKQKFIVGK